MTVTIDSVEHVRWLRDTLGPEVAGLGVALDCDASLRVGRVHLGVRRSPTRTPEQALAVVRAALGVGLDVRGVMFYDAQVAGLPDAGPHVRVLKRRSVRELARAARRRGGRGAQRDRPAVRQRRGHGQPAPVRGATRSSPSWPPGPGSTRRRSSTATTTSPSARRWRSRCRWCGGRHRATSRPSAAATCRAVSRGGRGCRRRCVVACRWCAPRRPVRCRRRCTATDADGLRVGDRVWLRGAKAGELLERFDVVHLVSGGELVGTVPSYRGEGRNFG